MIKYIALLCLLASTSAQAIHIQSKTAHVDIDTDKVSSIDGPVFDDLVVKYLDSITATADLPGDRVVLINSPGGLASSGNIIITAMEIEKSAGIKQICAVVGKATSMAFNILTHCDVRLATRDSVFLVHKLESGGLPPGTRHTAKNLREAADRIEQMDEPHRQANSKAMHLSLNKYDERADAETTWTASQLYKMHYLQGIVKVK